MKRRKPTPGQIVEYRRIYRPGDTTRQRKADAEHADALIRALEKANQIGDELIVMPDKHGRITRDAEKRAIARMARKYIEHGGRLRSEPTGHPAPTLLERCEALAMRASAVANKRIFDQRLMTDAIYTAVSLLEEARANPLPRGRGRPSVPKSPHGREFIARIAEAWESGTGCTARSGDGDTDSFNFNNFLAAAFALAGVRVSRYSLPRITRDVLG